MKIQLIEDNEDLRNIYTQLFESAGHTVASNDNGLNGITAMVEYQPDAVLLDIMMPEMDGYEFLSALKNNTSMEPMVIACSNLSQQIDIDRALTSGADAYLKKSDYLDDSLVTKVEQLYVDFLEKKSRDDASQEANQPANL